MSTLRETQDAVFRSLVERDDAAAAAQISGEGLQPAARLNIYRNTFIGSLTTALRLSFPAVLRLVGAAFFETAARLFIEAQPPRCAYLDMYGAEFPAFLAGFAPAAALTYLPGVARLEWAVTMALHAPDVPVLDLARLAAALHREDQERIALVPDPAIGLVQTEHPVDAIWRAVLAQDDPAMAAIDLASGPVWLLVERGVSGVDVQRLDEPSWRFLAALCAGSPLPSAIACAPGIDASAQLAAHLAAGRFVDFERGRNFTYIRSREGWA